jgi:hypothetical protein
MRHCGRGAHFSAGAQRAEVPGAAEHELAKKQSEAILNDMIGLLVKHLKKGDRVRIGFARRPIELVGAVR